MNSKRSRKRIHITQQDESSQVDKATCTSQCVCVCLHSLSHHYEAMQHPTILAGCAVIEPKVEKWSLTEYSVSYDVECNCMKFSCSCLAATPL